VLREAVAGMVELEVVDDSVWLPEMATAADGSTLGGGAGVERSTPSWTPALLRFPVGDGSVEDASR